MKTKEEYSIELAKELEHLIGKAVTEEVQVEAVEICIKFIEKNSL